MKDPFLLDLPAVVSFSGGRTSGYLLWRVLGAFGGALPPGCRVVFANTGKERPETLAFVEWCAVRWGVAVVWLEYTGRGRRGYRAASFATASRAGEPFAALIRHKQRLPDTHHRFCTQWLKILTAYRYARAELGWETFTDAVGLRADEPHRVAKLAPDPEQTPGRDPVAPLARAGVRLADVRAFWDAQPFDLALGADEGNCDLCFLKGRAKAARLIRARPESVGWWAGQEAYVSGKAGRPSSFRKGLPVLALARDALHSPELPFPEEPDFPSCGCTD